ncbi:hypothetical protein JCM6882_001868 [Rhodosporidiobolus microsporus]
MSSEWWGSTTTGRCVESGNTRVHAHLLGGNWVDKRDLAPSAVLCVVFFLALAGIGWRYRQYRVKALFAFVAAFFCSGIAFAIRAAIANTSPRNLTRSSVAAEQIFLVLGQLLLLLGAVLYTRAFMLRATLVHWPNTFLYASSTILVVSFILACVAFSRLPDPPNSYFPSLQYTQMRIASAILPFILLCLVVLLLPLVKLFAPFLPNLELWLLVLTAWFLWVPAFYSFCVVTITSDSSDLVCSQLFFYLSFGLFPLLSLIPLLALPMPRWGFLLAPGDLLPGGVAPMPATSMALAGESAALYEAAHEAQFARMREAEEARRLRAAKQEVGANAAAAGLVAHSHGHGPYDDPWNLHLH